MLEHCPPDRLQQFDAVMSAGTDQTPAELVSALANLSHEMGSAEADALLAAHPHLFAHSALLTRGFYELAVTGECSEIGRIRKLGFTSPTTYSDIMAGMMIASYHRVSDIFDWLDFASCRKFVMVGCGQVPVTALHVSDRHDVQEIACIDIRPDAVDDAAYLFSRLGKTNMVSSVCSGQDYDYTGADFVYVANMVRGKLAVVEQVLATANEIVEIVVRAPVGLGRLWTEDLGDLSALGMRVARRGHVSRHQAQDQLLERA